MGSSEMAVVKCGHGLTRSVSSLPVLAPPRRHLPQPIIDNPNSLLSGDHTRTICKPTPTARKGGIMMFAVKTLQCLGCKCPISDEEATLCGRCRPKEAEIFMTKALKVFFFFLFFFPKKKTTALEERREHLLQECARSCSLSEVVARVPMCATGRGRTADGRRVALLHR